MDNAFQFKDHAPKDITSGTVYKFQCECRYGECVTHLNLRIGEHFSILTLTKKKVKPMNTSGGDHLPFCNHTGSFDDFSILARGSKTFLLVLKGSI